MSNKKETIDAYLKLQKKRNQGKNYRKVDNENRMELLTELKKLNFGVHEGTKGGILVFDKVYKGKSYKAIRFAA